MRLIDIDALIEKHCEGCSEDIREGCKIDPVCATLMWFEEAPVIDAVPVVRCKDCKHWEDGWLGYCTKCHAAMHYDGFCSNGERREADG